MEQGDNLSINKFCTFKYNSLTKRLEFRIVRKTLSIQDNFITR